MEEFCDKESQGKQEAKLTLTDSLTDKTQPILATRWCIEYQGHEYNGDSYGDSYGASTDLPILPCADTRGKS